jgi:hypothetical protein
MSKERKNMSKIVKINADVVYGRGGRVFVVSDLHGNANDFWHWQNSVGFTTADYCIINGDAIDRGPDGIALLLHFMRNSNNYLFLMGNHEELMLGAIKEADAGFDRFYQNNWYANGGNPTCEAFCALPNNLQNEIVSFLENSPYVGEIVSDSHESIFVAHAGLNAQWLYEIYNNVLSKDKHGMSNITWARDEWWKSPNDLGRMLITGHTSTSKYGGIRGEVLWADTTRRLVIDCNTINTHKVGYVHLEPTRCFFGSY